MSFSIKELKGAFKLPIHTTYYNGFFLLRIPVVINGQQATIGSDEKGWLTLNCRYPAVGVTFDSLVTDINDILQTHGMENVTNYWCEKVPLFQVKISSQKNLKQLLSLEDKIKEELALKMATRMSAQLHSHNPIVPPPGLSVQVRPQVYLLIPDSRCGDGKVIKVTKANMANCITLCSKSDVFTFENLFRAYQINPNRVDEGPKNLAELTSELKEVVDWYHLGVRLNIPDYQLKIIAKNNPRDVATCRTEMLSLWMNTVQGKWATIVQALVETGSRTLACEIALKHDIPVPSTPLEVNSSPAKVQEVSSFQGHSFSVELKNKMKIKKLKLDIEHKDEKLAQQDQALKCVKHEKKMIEKEVKTLEDKLNVAQRKIAQLKEQRKSLEEKLKQKKKETESGTQQYIASQNEKEIARLRSDIAEVKNELDKTKLDLEVSEKSLHKAQLELVEKSTEVQMLREAREETNLQLKANREQIDGLMQVITVRSSDVEYQTKFAVSTEDYRHEKCLPFIPSKKQNGEELLSVLGLADFYPQKLTLRHALEIREDTLEGVKHLYDTDSKLASVKKNTHKTSHHTDPKLHPFLILQKIAAFDYRCRTKLVLTSDLYSTPIRLLSDRKNATELVVHPMDGLLAVLHCADNFLRQDLMSRLATCQLAIPLLLPDPIEPHKVTLPIWAMRSIVKEWHTSNGTSKEGQIVSYPSPIVSFLRIGKFRKSKSHMMNYVISDSGHNIFFHYNCDGGSAKHLLVNGLVEVCWYLPSKREMILSDLVNFTNLHGDARECTKQVKFLSKVSFMNFVLINEENQNEEALKVLETLAAAPGGLVLLLVEPFDDSWHEWLEPIKKSVQVISLENMNEAEIRDTIKEEINCTINEKWNDALSHFSLEKHCDAARFCDIIVDEDDQECQKGKKLAKNFEDVLKSTHRTESLKKSLPLQGPHLWQNWAVAEKEQYRQTMRGKCEVECYSQQQRQKMRNIRKEQVKYTEPLQPLMNCFLNSLLTHHKKIRHYFLVWIQLFLDSLSREQLPHLHAGYKQKVLELEEARKGKYEQAEKACMTEIQELNRKLIDVSFGLEHLLREVSQIYEAVAALKQVPQKSEHILRLPEVAAELMIEGCPLELMDGDVAHVPITWVSAVLSKVQELLENPRLFVLSVMGIQSSGKSTFLSTVFGVRFSTSARRCTRGAFMQLLPIHSSLRDECKCDYFLIVNTEGLRAPELAEQTHKHDYELATVVIGLANLTIINLSGETVGDMNDILQTVVHAFLRMRSLQLKPSCHFVHQNVMATAAGEKTMMGHMKLKEALDMKTQAAAKEEGLEYMYKHFTDVFDFDSEKHVFYFQNLWNGDPPMAPVNPGYSTNAQFLKLCLITHAKQAYSTDLKLFQDHLNDLWQAILHENFVFSFKNTLEVTAYNTLDGAYSNWSWKFKQDMMTWKQKAHNKMNSCEISLLPSVFGECIAELPKYVHDIHQRLTEEMSSVIKKIAQQEIIIKRNGEMETRLLSLQKQLMQQAENHCKSCRTNREVLAMVDSMKVAHRGFILEHVKGLASELELERGRGKLNDKQLEEKFNELWKRCIDEIKSPPVHTVEICVKADIQACLIEFPLLRPSQRQLLKKLEGIPLGTGHHSLLLQVQNVHVKEKRVYWPILPREYPTKEAQVITDKLLEHQREYLQQLKMKYYKPSLVTELLCKLFEEISHHSTDVAFTEEYRVDIALTVCRYALIIFLEMVDTERKENDPGAYFKREVRGPFLKIFKDEYKQITREITAAAVVCDLLLHAVKKEVLASLGPKIADDARGANDFLHSKPALKTKVLLDIGENLDLYGERHFGDCLSYLEDPVKSIHSWLEQYTLQYCNGKRFAEIACTEVFGIVILLKDKVSKLSKGFSQKAGEFKIEEWLTKFHSEIQSTGKLHLDIAELCQLGGVHQLKDVSHFTQEVMKGLKTLQSKLKTEFEYMPLNVMDNWIKRPHDYLFEDLAGCTAKCPFCKEQCDLTNPDHYPSTKHSVAMHRPRCLGRQCWKDSGEMVLNLCTTGVASDVTFQNSDTSGEYQKYAKSFPDWFIPTDLSPKASLYWKWLLGHYADNVANAFDLKKSTIPSEWKRLQWKDVKRSLKNTYKV